jgi:hypothetical protein
MMMKISMPNSFTTTTTTGYGTRIGRSVGGMLVGGLLFVASFGVLFWNEGRTDLASVAKKAIELPTGAVTTDASAQKQLVSASGVVTSTEVLGDGAYLKPGEYLAIDRNAEMYAWVEKKTENSHTNVGGSETTETTYDYTMEWTNDPMTPSEMEHPTDHENPAMGITDDEFEVKSLTVGSYTVSGADLPSTSPLSLTKDVVNLTGGAVLSGGYVFQGVGTEAKPELGDIRVSYGVVGSGFDGTVFGELQGSKIVSYSNEDGDSLFRVFSGSRAKAITTLHSEFVTMGWVLRIVGFLMMWFGLAGVLGPISTLLDILPFLGSTSRFLVSVITFPIALVLTVVTVIVSMILHSLIALIIVALLLIGAAVVAAKRLPKKARATV